MLYRLPSGVVLRQSHPALQMIYSLPPLQPVCQTAWLVWALGSLSQAAEQNPSDHRAGSAGNGWNYVGNVGLMELDALKQRTGGWVASELGNRSDSDSSR